MLGSNPSFSLLVIRIFITLGFNPSFLLLVIISFIMLGSNRFFIIISNNDFYYVTVKP